MVAGNAEQARARENVDNYLKSIGLSVGLGDVCSGKLVFLSL